MSKRHESKHKIDRRLGENLWGRPGSPLNALIGQPVTQVLQFVEQHAGPNWRQTLSLILSGEQAA